MEADVQSDPTTTTPTPTFPERLTERDLAHHWRVTPRTLQRWRVEGCGPDWMRIGSRILYSRTAILAFEAHGRNGGTSS